MRSRPNGPTPCASSTMPPKTRMPRVDLFKGFHAGKQLVAPDVVAHKVVDRLVLGPVEHGRTYSYAEL